MSVANLGLWFVVILLYSTFCSTQESTKRLTMKKLPIVVCFHFKVIVDNLGCDNFYNVKSHFTP